MLATSLMQPDFIQLFTDFHNYFSTPGNKVDSSRLNLLAPGLFFGLQRFD